MCQLWPRVSNQEWDSQHGTFLFFVVAGPVVVPKILPGPFGLFFSLFLSSSLFVGRLCAAKGIYTLTPLRPWWLWFSFFFFLMVVGTVTGGP